MRGFIPRAAIQLFPKFECSSNLSIMQYLNFSPKRGNHSIQHSFNTVFKKIETVLFSFLCILLLLVSKTNREFTKDVSFAFVSASLPVVNIAAFPFNTVINLLTDFGELIDAKQENKKLKAELEELKMFYIDSLNINEENKKLRDSLEFVTERSTGFKMAKIVGRANQLFNQTLFIDIGENKGVEEGEIVTANRAVIGRIEEVFSDRSRLLLLNDATSRIPVITSKARVRGILAGNGSNVLEILYLPKNHKIEVGDSVFTSGDGDTLPSGLFVGTVKKVTSDSALVVLGQDIADAEIVSIIEYDKAAETIRKKEDEEHAAAEKAAEEKALAEEKEAAAQLEKSLEKSAETVEEKGN